MCVCNFYITFSFQFPLHSIFSRNVYFLQLTSVKKKKGFKRYVSSFPPLISSAFCEIALQMLLHTLNLQIKFCWCCCCCCCWKGYTHTTGKDTHTLLERIQRIHTVLERIHTCTVVLEWIHTCTLVLERIHTHYWDGYTHSTGMDTHTLLGLSYRG